VPLAAKMDNRHPWPVCVNALQSTVLGAAKPTTKAQSRTGELSAQANIEGHLTCIMMLRAKGAGVVSSDE